MRAFSSRKWRPVDSLVVIAPLLNQIFCAAIVAGSKEVESAKRLIAFLASERASRTIKANGMEPLGKR